MLFDSHAHLDDEKFDIDRNEVINQATLDGVTRILNVSASIESLDKCLELASKYDFMYASVGIHPHEVSNMGEDTLIKMLELSKDKKVVAVGEIGLDYYYDHSPRDVQKYWFKRQIAFAKEVNLPIIVHDREAHEDTLKIIKDENAKLCGGVFHCYSGSKEMAQEVLKNEFYISFSGAITFKNNKKFYDIVNYVPEDRMLIETDSPYLTPEPFRGKRNFPGHVGIVAEKIAEIKGVSYEYVAEITFNNAKRLFRTI